MIFHNNLPRKQFMNEILSLTGVQMKYNIAYKLESTKNKKEMPALF
jgi:hypothetical protein